MTRAPAPSAGPPFEVTFGDPETVTIGELMPGDFVIEVPAQGGLRGTTVNSGVKSIVESFDYTTNWRRGGRRFTVASRRLTFLSSPAGWCISWPSSFTVTVRRRIGGGAPPAKAEAAMTGELDSRFTRASSKGAR